MGSVRRLLGSSGSLEKAVAEAGLNVGSPAEVVEQVLAFGDIQRQLFAVDFAGLPESVVHEQLDLIGPDVLPVLRRELAKPAPAERVAA